jgi:N6-adenosine-specific RNA methylase IME4
MSLEQIAELNPPADDEAHLYLWTTNAFICEAHEITRAWGFEPKTVLTWVKVRHGDGEPSMKMGYWFRSATEHIVFGVRGGLRLVDKAVEPTAFHWVREGHSVKPAAFYDLVERVSPGPYLDLFTRQQRLGWDSWGWGHEEVGA